MNNLSLLDEADGKSKQETRGFLVHLRLQFYFSVSFEWQCDSTVLNCHIPHPL